MTEKTEVADSAMEAYARGMRDAAAMLDMSNQTIQLHAGELSPLEMLTVQAVLAWKRHEMTERARVVAAVGAEVHQMGLLGKAGTGSVVEIDCWQPLPAIVLAHKICGRGSDAHLVEKAVELQRLNPVNDPIRMSARVAASVADRLPEVLECQRI